MADSPPQTHVGRVAVVTGAARGIGMAISLGFASRGASVVGVDIVDTDATAELVRDAGGRWAAVQVDLTTPGVGAAVAAEVQRAFGRCDILVNNAGIADPVHFDRLDPDLWRRVHAVNLDAPFHLCRAIVPAMRDGGWGRVVNIASGSVLASMPCFVAYRASKMGLIGLTRALAAELGDSGITVNVVSPGVTVTQMTLESIGQDLIDASAAARAIHRVAVPADLVGAVLFLTSDDARFVTGQTLLVNGGASFL